MQHSSLEAVIEDHKEGYCRVLRQTQTTLNKINLNFNDLIELEIKILEYFAQNERGTNLKLLEFAKANRNTLKKSLVNLVDKKFLIMHSKGRGRWYSKK